MLLIGILTCIFKGVTSYHKVSQSGYHGASHGAFHDASHMAVDEYVQ